VSSFAIYYYYMVMCLTPDIFS